MSRDCTVEEDLNTLLRGMDELRMDVWYRPHLESALQVLGHEDAEIKRALDILYKVN